MMPRRFADLFGQRDSKKTTMPIGVDFSAETLHMVQCERHASGLAIRAAASVPYPVERSALLADRKALKKFVRGALASAPFQGQRVYSALPPADVRIVPLTVNVSNGQSEATLVIKALREKLRSDLSSEVVDYLQVRSGDGAGTEANVLAAVAPRDKVLAHLQQLDEVGMEPVALDIGPAALARLLATMQQGDHEHSVLLMNFGAERSYITVVWGRRLILDREVEFGEARLAVRLASALGIDRNIALSMLQKHEPSNAAQHGTPTTNDMTRAIDEILHSEFAAMAEEIGRTLIYIASKTRGRAAKTMYLNGSLAHYPYVVMRMKKLVDVPVELLNPFSMLQAPTAAAYGTSLVPAKGIALATGLALRG